MAKSVVGLFDASTSVESVKRDLEQMGVPKRNIHALDRAEAAEGEPRSWTDRVAAFFGFTGDQQERDIGAAYADAMNEGDTLLIVDVDDAMADRTAAVMNQYGALDIGARGRTRVTREIPAPPESRTIPITEQTTIPLSTEQATIPVIEEELEIGKRTIERGGVRVHSYVAEMPVEEVVRLREEHVNVERHAVDRPVTAADTFQETTVVVTETAEQPVVAKQARVVEEVVINKTEEEREETIAETIRRQDVDVEPIRKTGTGGR
jgi:stress response protein YsnF